ncbi:MAG: hypothetical protein OEV63_10500 [Gammaproteobacteria bacterium]|nr:hypothetical protein [Gammaproteobacteria bacterium]MDH5215988.1 hypothetical protein [Gammaproteobacteria bacterium]
MHPVSNSTQTGFQFPANRETANWLHNHSVERSGRAENAQHADHAHRSYRSRHTNHEHHDSGSRAKQIFRQEFAQAFRVEFRSELRLSADSTGAYRATSEVDDVAGEVVTAARNTIENERSDPAQMLFRVRQTVNVAASVSRQEVDGEEGQRSIDAIERQVSQGLDEIEADDELMAMSALSIDARSRQRSIIRIRTTEGDIVKLDLRQIDRLSVSDVATRSDEGSSSVTEVSVSSRSRLILKVNGDLNEAELEAIRNVFAQAEDLADRFFGGDLNAALEVSAGLQYDSGQLARVSMRFRSSQQLHISQSIVNNAPIAAPAADTPVVAAPGSDSPEPAAPVVPASELTEPVVAGDGDVEQLPEPAVESPIAGGEEAPAGGFFSGFGSLINYLGMVADYLDESLARFRELIGAESGSGRLRLDISTSFRLDVLRAVMAQKIPDETLEPQPGPSSAIEVLDNS